MKTVVSTTVTIAALMMPWCLAAEPETPKENGDAGKKSVAGSPVQTENSPVELRKLMDTPLRDPSICRGPDGTYYLTGTVEPFWGFNNQNGIKVWKSPDLTTGNRWASSGDTAPALAQEVPRSEEAALGAGDPLS